MNTIDLGCYEKLNQFLRLGWLSSTTFATIWPLISHHSLFSKCWTDCSGYLTNLKTIAFCKVILKNKGECSHFHTKGGGGLLISFLEISLWFFACRPEMGSSFWIKHQSWEKLFYGITLRKSLHVQSSGIKEITWYMCWIQTLYIIQRYII